MKLRFQRSLTPTCPVCCARTAWCRFRSTWNRRLWRRHWQRSIASFHQKRALFSLTHLLGGSAPTEDIAEYCKSRGLELWEDCAQRFPDVRPRSDVSAVSFYSFGPLKTATALLGAIADVQDPSLRAAMQQRQAGYPAYRRTALAWRTGKLAVLAELASHPLAYGAVVTTAERMGLDPRTTLRSASKSFGNTTNFEGLRQRPSAPTLRLLAHRLDLTNSHAGAKTALADELTARIGKARVLGSASNSHHWLFVVRSVHPEKLQRDLLSAGFDALRGISNLKWFPRPRSGRKHK